MITSQDIFADMHTHTIFSGHALSTIQENISAAESAGLSFLAITDHFWGVGSDLEKNNELNRLRFMENDVNFSQRKIYIFGGAEFNLGQQISKIKKICNLSWKIVGLHDFFINCTDLSLYNLYEMFSDAIGTGFHAFAHIERELNKIEHGKYAENPLHEDIRVFLEKIVLLAQKANIYLEVNENSLCKPNSGNYERMEYWLKIAKAYGNKISLGSDAHFSAKVGKFNNAINLLNKLDYPSELILNANQDLLNKMVRHYNK